MKKAVSFLLSIVMTVSIVGGLDFSAYAAEGTSYFSEEDIQFLTSKFSYTLTESEKALYTDTIKNISPDMEWSETDWDVVQFYCNNIQKVWGAADLMLPDSITENEFAKLGNRSLTYISSSIEIFKNIYYITQTDVNNIEKVYHGIGIFQSVCNILGWSLGTFGSVLSVVGATLPIANLLYNSSIQESLAFYEAELAISYYAKSPLPKPDEAMMKPAFADYLGKKDLENGLYALYFKYSFMKIADNMKSMTETNPIGEKSYYSGHTYQVLDVSMNWNEANNYCESLGGHLVTITNEEEQTFIFELIILGNKSTYWIGITDVETEGVWKWITGEKYQYTNWNRGEPNNGGPGPEDWGEMIASTGKWNDGELNGDQGIHSLDNHGFICEWDYYVDPYPTMNDEHNYEITVINETCTEAGYTIHQCTDCELSYYSDNTPATGHNFTYNNTISPTCTAQGYDLYKCSNCGKEERRNQVKALGHNYVYDSTKKQTCTAQGYDTYKCSRCSATEKRNYVSALGHNYIYQYTVDPTCAAQGYDLYTCSVCGATEQRNHVNTLNHNNILTDTVLSTCSTAGYYEYTCSVCGNISQETIAKLDGSVLTGVLEDAQEKLNNNTFSEEGYTNLKAVYDKHKNGLYTYTSQIEVDHAVTEINTAINMAVSETVLGDTAGDTTEDGLSWSWSRETGVLTVTGEGVMDGYDSATMPWYEVLPYTTSIIIGEGITSIGRYAFYNAVNVTNISLPSTLTNLDERAFEYCTSVEELVVPDSVTSIGYGAFGNLTGLKKVSVPASATYRSYGFYNANAVEEIIITPGTDGVIPDSDVTAEQGWLWDWMMKSTGNFGPWKYADNAVVTISEGVTSIGAKTFYNCAGISEISIPESITSISSEAFYNCDMLRNIELGKNVESIGVSSFAECDNLQKITVLNPNCTFSDSSIVGNMGIEGYRNSTAQAYAEANSMNFIPIEVPDTLKISTVSLSLESSITMNFKVLKTDLTDFKDPYVVFTCEGDELTVTEYKEQGEYYVFSYPGISPQLMNDEVNAVLYATYSNDGEVYNSPAKVMSVREYAYTLLERYSSDDYAELRTLLVDLLNYGAAAQTYVSYQTDELVNSDLTDEQRSWGTNDEPELENIRDYHYMTIDSPESEWLGSGLVLNNSVTIRAKFSAEDIENKTVVITCGNSEFIYTKEDFVKAEDGNYYVYCDELFANEMSKEILLTVYDNGIQCSDTMRFSIESYAKLVHDSYAGTALDDLTTAMIRYGRSAEAYGS